MAELTTAVSIAFAAALAISEFTAATTKPIAAECGETNGSDAIGKPNGGVTAMTLQLLTVKSTCLRSQRPD